MIESSRRPPARRCVEARSTWATCARRGGAGWGAVPTRRRCCWNRLVAVARRLDGRKGLGLDPLMERRCSREAEDEDAARLPTLRGMPHVHETLRLSCEVPNLAAWARGAVTVQVQVGKGLS
ncbi:hypothetical protein FOCC_FOCC001777, partial [Frankliniella occidentalis]